MSIIIFIILSSICLLALSYLAGSLALMPFWGWINRQEAHASLFFKVHAGLWALTTGIAVYYTSGKTILSYLVFAYLYIVLKKGKRNREKPKIEIASLGLLSLVLICFIVWQAIRTGFFVEEIKYLGDLDYGIYITVAEYLKKTGVENPSPWYAVAPGGENLPFTPYHYGDLWMNLLFGFGNSQIAPFYWYNLSFVPFLGALTCFFCLVLVEKLVSRQLLPLEKLIALLLPFSVGWLYVFYPKMAFIISPFVHVKLNLIFLLIASGFFCIVINNKPLFFFCLSFSFIINIIYAPILLVGSFLYEVLMERKVKWANAYLLLIIPMMYFVCFYSIFGTFETSATPVSIDLQVYLWAAVKICAYTSIYFILFNFPLFLIGWILFRAQIHISSLSKRMILFLICLYFCASVLWAISSFLVESFQFYTGLATQFAILLYLLFFILSLNQGDSSASVRAIKIILGVHLLLSLIFLTFYYDQRQSAYSHEFINDAESSLSSLSQLGGYLPNEDAMDVWEADPRMCTPCNFLKAIGNNYWAYSLSVPENISSTAFPERTTAIQAAPFYQYIQQLKKKGVYNSYEEAQLAFLKSANIGYIVVEKGALVPAAIQAMVSREIEDDLSGTKVLLLSRD